jgi:hypothetical protein
MFLIPLINVIAQAVAALVIFVVGYLLLLLCAIAGLAIAHLMYKAARLTWSYAAARYTSSRPAQPKDAELVQRIPCQAEIIRQHLVPIRRSSL